MCSVILITELTRKYNELYNFNRDLVVELAFITAGLYLLMSYPMAVLARCLETAAWARTREVPTDDPRDQRREVPRRRSASSTARRSRCRRGRSRRSSGRPAAGRARCSAASTGWSSSRKARSRSAIRSSSSAGETPPKATLLQLRRTVGMVFQQFNLFPHMTVLQNVMSGPVYALGQAASRGRSDREEAARPRRAGREVRREAGATFRRAATACCDRPGACG